ncbi:MAG: UDP-2,3-diacylglucosamine diphosphatase LpxI [Myxococcales bacterium]|nr:UDP-2,3-diacylglucosamine diphosphatase LpxI [Myxococcales bacterium]MDP3505253.1 UDP-2,3-diacylglucosamine diphosphatase LpxI [Myxococcales bacterium]
MRAIGLIAGNGRFPTIFAQAARAKGLAVHAVAHELEADPSLSQQVDSLTWVKVGQLDGIVNRFKAQGVTEAVMAGGIGRIRSFTQARPDLGALKVAASLRSMRDDEMLRAVAAYFEKHGVRIVAPTDYVPEVLAGMGHLAGPAPTKAQLRDAEVGHEVATALGQVDVGQTVMVKDGAVLAVEAVEGTDEAIRRGGKYGGKGAVVVKRSKPGQDLRFDLPAVGPMTLEVMREAGASALIVEAGKTVLLDKAQLFKWADRLSIAIVGR